MQLLARLVQKYPKTAMRNITQPATITKIGNNFKISGGIEEIKTAYNVC